MASKAIQKDALDVILAALSPENENVCRVSLLTGLRVSDVLGIRTEQIKQRRFTVIESKTNKKKRVTLPIWLCESILSHAGKVYAFPHRLKVFEPRTRQAVFKDLRRVTTALRLGKGASPHSMRKSFAVQKYHACGDMKKVQQLLNHSGEAVTALYCMAEQLGFKRSRGAGAPEREGRRRA